MRTLREVRCWTQQELADRAGLHRTYIGSVERGERNVSLLNIHALAAALDVAPETLFSDTEIRRRPASPR